jgi:hypothetical protein
MAKSKATKITIKLPGQYVVPGDPSPQLTSPQGMASGFLPPMPTADPPTDAAVEGGKRAPKGQ